jgi:hypothetical protein
MFQQEPTGISENDAAPAAMEEAGTSGRLEPKHLSADSGLVTAEFQRCARNTPAICHARETLQII